MRFYSPKDKPIGPHPCPMWEADFAAFENRGMWGEVVEFIEAERTSPSGSIFLSVLVHPYSTDGDYEDHTTNAHWAGSPLQLRIGRGRR